MKNLNLMRAKESNRNKPFWNWCLTVCLVSFCWVPPSLAVAAGDDAITQAQIQAILEALDEATNHRDLDALLTFMAPGAQFVTVLNGKQKRISLNEYREKSSKILAVCTDYDRQRRNVRIEISPDSRSALSEDEISESMTAAGQTQQIHYLQTTRFALVDGRLLVNEVSVVIGDSGSNGQELKGDALERGRQKLMTFLLNKRLISKVTMPAYTSGIDLMTNGTWDQHWATRMIKEHGVGVEVDEAVTVTAVILKKKHIEIHLNGGGFGTFGDVLTTSEYQRVQRSAGTGKSPGGSRINLKFNRPITQADLDELSKLADYLDVVVDTTALRQDSLKQNIPEIFRDAAARGEIIPGMDKPTVFAILGEPKNKSVDLSGDSPIEKWQYELKNLKIRVVTFLAGKVSKVDEF